MKCPLCGNPADPFRVAGYHECPVCRGIFRDLSELPSAERERSRYELHNNDVNDPGYRAFVSPITDRVLKRFGPNDRGLDFGCGPGPVVSVVLAEHGYTVDRYDPFFADNPQVFERLYDYVACCEVIEHFFNPGCEFSRLASMLRPGGELVCMTWLYDDSIDFRTWHYSRDFTHVFFYRPETVDFIATAFGFGTVLVDGRMIVFKSP